MCTACRFLAQLNSHPNNAKNIIYATPPANQTHHRNLIFYTFNAVPTHQSAHETTTIGKLQLNHWVSQLTATEASPSNDNASALAIHFIYVENRAGFPQKSKITDQIFIVKRYVHIQTHWISKYNSSKHIWLVLWINFCYK